MAKLKKRLQLRIPDRAALAVSLVLVLTAAGSTLSDPLVNALKGVGSGAPSTAMPVKAEKPDLDAAPVDSSGGAKPLTSRFLLFRHG